MGFRNGDIVVREVCASVLEDGTRLVQVNYMTFLNYGDYPNGKNCLLRDWRGLECRSHSRNWTLYSSAGRILMTEIA